jgi:hypothetical protein
MLSMDDPSVTECPKCGNPRSPGNEGSPPSCTACGLYFDKWEQRAAFVAPSRKRAQAQEAPATESAWRSALRDRLAFVPEDVTTSHLVGRAVLLLLLLVWGLRIALMDYRDGEMGTSFMHSVLLPFHEAGHVLFIPFGEFMTILGGSLFQLLFPLIVAAALLWTNRDPFGAGIGVWWCGVSLIDLAPYIYDARAPQLMLLGGHTGEDGPHDWIYLLGVFGQIQHSQAYGAIAHKLGIAIMLAGVVWAARVLWRWKSKLAEEA